MTEQAIRNAKMKQIDRRLRASLLSNDAKVVEATDVSEPSLSSSHTTSETQNVSEKVIDPSSSTS